MSKHICKGSDFDVTEAMRNPCYNAWTEHREYWEEGDAPDIVDFRCGFVYGWLARSLQPDIADMERAAQSILHTLIRRDPDRAKVIIRKLSQK